MKRRRLGIIVLCVLLSVVLVLYGWVGVRYLQARTLFRVTDAAVDVYVPQGLADRFVDLNFWGFLPDDAAVWAYDCSEKEAQLLQEELHVRWQEADEAMRVRLQDQLAQMTDWAVALSEHCFCTAYDLKAKRMIPPENASLCHQIFLYDTVANVYYCLLLQA